LWTCHSTILFCCLLDCFGCEHVILELLLCEPTLVVWYLTSCLVLNFVYCVN